MSGIYTALNNLVQIFSDYLQTYDLSVINIATIKSLIITDSITFPGTYVWNSIINQVSTLVGTNHFVQSIFSGNITQTNGSNQFLDSAIGTITQPNGVIIQNGNTNWNLLKKTQITDLEVLTSLVLPSNITIAGSTYTNDLVLNNATIQQTNTTGINTFQATDFYNGNVRFSNNITQIGGALTTATLKNLTVEGTSNLGLITGTTINDLYNTKLNKTNDTATNITFSGTVTGLSKANVGLSACDNTSDLNKPVSDATNTQLNLKATYLTPHLSGFTYFNNCGVTPFTEYGSGWFGAICSNFSGGNAELSFINTGLKSTQPSSPAFQWYLATSNATKTLLCTMFNNGNTNFIGSVTSSNILATNKTDISQNKYDIGINRYDISQNRFDISKNKYDISQNKFNITTLQGQVNSILSDPSVQSITIGTTTTIASGSNCYITNTGTATDQILNFYIARGSDGSNGSDGSDGHKGNTGDTGPKGDTGSDGGGALLGAAAGAAAGAASGAVSGGAAGAAAASSICAGTLATLEPQITALQSETAGLQIQVDTLGTGMSILATDVDAINGEILIIGETISNIKSIPATSTYIDCPAIVLGEIDNVVVNIGPATQLGNVVINGTVTFPLMSSFFGFTSQSGFMSQLT